MTLRNVTVKEKILLQLFDFTRFADAYEAPEDVTQEGIARAVGIRVHHVNQYVGPLIEEEWVAERTGHVARKTRRRKLYTLTPKGRSEVARLRGALLTEIVSVRKKDGERIPIPLARVFQEVRRGSTLLVLLNELATTGTIAQEPETSAPEFVDFTQEAATVEHFFGREGDVEVVRKALMETPVVVVTGMAGIGKTSLASRVCASIQRERSRFWREIRPWDTGMDLAVRLAAFLKSLGRGELHGTLRGSALKEIGQVEEPLRADLEGLPALLVFDDAHQATEDAQHFLSILLRVLRRVKGPSALVLARTPPTFYSRREVAVDASVQEIALQGLDPKSSIALLAELGVADPLVGSLVEACGGIPLFLRLVGHAGARGAPGEGWRTLETYIAEQIEPDLEDDERSCLQIGAFYYVPVLPDGLALSEDVSRRTLVNLRQKGLINVSDSGRYSIHDAIRRYFEGTLSGERKSLFGQRVADWLLEQGTKAASEGRLPDAIAYLGNAVAIESDTARRIKALNRLGEFRRHVGDYPGAIDAYRTALRAEAEVASIARLHQKIALCLENLGRLDEAEREIVEGLERLPQSPNLETAWLLEQRASIAYERQEYGRSLDDVEFVMGLMPGLPKDPELQGHLSNLRGLIHLYDSSRLDGRKADADFRDTIEAWQRAGYDRGLCMAYNNLFLAAMELGDVDHALPNLERSVSLARTIGDVPALETASFTKAWFLAEHLGDYEAAEALYKETYRLAKETHQRDKMIWHYYHLAILYVRTGRYQEARESMEYFLGASGFMVNNERRVHDLAGMSRICLLAGDGAGADQYLREASDLSARVPSAYMEFPIEWAQAAINAQRGDVAKAKMNFVRAVERCPVGQGGELLLDYGRFLISVDEKEEAKRVLLQARGQLARSNGALERQARDILQAMA